MTKQEKIFKRDIDDIAKWMIEDEVKHHYKETQSNLVNDWLSDFSNDIEQWITEETTDEHYDSTTERT